MTYVLLHMWEEQLHVIDTVGKQALRGRKAVLTVRISTHEAGRTHIYHLLIGVCQYFYTLANHNHSSDRDLLMFFSLWECLGQADRHTYMGIPPGQGSGPNFFSFGSGHHSIDKHADHEVFQQIHEFVKERWSSRECGRRLHLLPAILHSLPDAVRI